MQDIPHDQFVHKRFGATPWDDVPGFWAAVNRFFYRFTGPAQLGAGRQEAPVAPSAGARCPICGDVMGDHVREVVADQRTLLHCPGPRRGGA